AATPPTTAAPGGAAASPPATPGNTAAPGGSVAPGPAHLGPAPHHDLIDPELVGQLAPAALQAGTTALTMLPLLAMTAMSGLGNNTNSGGNTNPTTNPANTLGNLADTYGNGNTTTPGTGNLTTNNGNTTSGTSNTNIAVRYRQLYQHTVATAFNNLDNQLLHFITDLAAGHTIDKKAVTQLLRDVDVQLAQLGPTAYTTAGQQQVHQILTTAVTKAEHLVTGSHATATQTATEINQLTNQYLYNLAGKNY
ncbi:DUF4226 domain-containing protein, partial [Nocardia vaccinii]|uniref:DUF4226 domain-containing protein n=1 Tax=Nocardia vaccinii TaxID=1822 RepID=UPI000AE1DC46